MKLCPFCKEEKELINLTAPYISIGKEFNMRICKDCKKILDKNRYIRDGNGKYGLKF